MPRPPRTHMPIAVKREVSLRQEYRCKCGCGQHVSAVPKSNTNFDHRPPLRLRDINADGTDYDPPQHSAEHIDAICKTEHDRRTFGTGATTAGTDFGAIKKERKRNKPPRLKRKMPSRPFGPGRKFPAKGSVKFARKK